MSALRNPPRGRGFAPHRRAGSTNNPGLRVSDAERAEVADILSTHFSDGRLDEETFNERLDRAMRATTQADLSGLLADLPATGAPPGTQPERRRPRSSHRILFLLLVAVIAAVIGRALAWTVFPWLALGLLGFLWLRYGPRRNRRR